MKIFNPTPEETAALVARDPRGFGVLRTVRVAISWLRCDRRCAAHACRRTMLDRPDGEDRPLPLCSRCTLARYCSRDCQRTDWTRGHPYSHRALCAVLVDLMRSSDGAVVGCGGSGSSSAAGRRLLVVPLLESVALIGV